MALMKRFRMARQHRLTSHKRIKRPGNRYYQGGADPNKGKKKKSWYEVICCVCLTRYKINPNGNFICKCKTNV